MTAYENMWWGAFLRMWYSLGVYHAKGENFWLDNYATTEGYKYPISYLQNLGESK